MKLGYARVSTRDQNLTPQIEALTEAGCQKVFQDVACGAKSERPGLEALMSAIRSDDSLVVVKLDRLGRNLHHLIELANQLREKSIGLVSLNDPVDTSTPQGQLCFNLFACLAEFERSNIRERTRIGLTSARLQGRHGGRPKGLPEKAKPIACAAETLYRENQLTVDEIARQLGISKATLYSYLRHRNVPIGLQRQTADSP